MDDVTRVVLGHEKVTRVLARATMTFPGEHPMVERLLADADRDLGPR
jgi:hypothetical protein